MPAWAADRSPTQAAAGKNKAFRAGKGKEMFDDKRLTMKEKANEWWDGLEEEQRNVYLDEWILAAYKELNED